MLNVLNNISYFMWSLKYVAAAYSVVFFLLFFFVDHEISALINAVCAVFVAAIVDD